MKPFNFTAETSAENAIAQMVGVKVALQISAITVPASINGMAED